MPARKYMTWAAAPFVAFDVVDEHVRPDEPDEPDEHVRPVRSAGGAAGGLVSGGLASAPGRVTTLVGSSA